MKLPVASLIAASDVIECASMWLQEMKLPVASLIAASGVMPLLVELLEAGTQCLCSARRAQAPQWISPLLLLIDMYEKMAIASKRRAAVEQVVVSIHLSLLACGSRQVLSLECVVAKSSGCSSSCASEEHR